VIILSTHEWTREHPLVKVQPDTLRTNMIAIETATDACSVAMVLGGQVTQRHELIPRQHSQRLMGMLEALYPGGDIRSAGVQAIVFGEGPGSFTGLRIAASAAQGLAFAADIPAVGISTLACQALTAVRQGLVSEDSVILSLIDARIDQTYYALFAVVDGLPLSLVGPGVCAPEQLPSDQIVTAAAGRTITTVGSGASMAKRFPGALPLDVNQGAVELLPEARDLLPLAQAVINRGEVLRAEQVAPSYVQETIGWKKLSEQGKAS